MISGGWRVVALAAWVDLGGGDIVVAKVIRIPEALAERLRVHCKAYGLRENDFVVFAIVRLLEVCVSMFTGGDGVGEVPGD